MKKIQRIIGVMLWCLLAVSSASAQKGAMAELRPMFDHLKSLKTYSYQYRTVGQFPDGKKDEILTEVYMDRIAQNLCWKSREQLVMMNKDWVFKADHQQKTVGVFKIATYNKRNKDMLPDLQNIFKYDMASMFMDSVLMQYGKLLYSSKNGNLATYRIGFTTGGPLKEVTIIYNTLRQLPESIYFKTVSALDNRGGKAIIEIWCGHYMTTVPASVFEEKQYFTIQKGKPVLHQFKNYKVYSVL